MYVRISRLRKVVAEQARVLFEALSEDRDRLRRGAPGEYDGESHTGFEEAVETEGAYGEAKEKDEDEAEEEPSEKKPQPKKAKAKEDKPKAEPKQKPKQKSPKEVQALKGLKKAKKAGALPKHYVDPKSGKKQETDLDAIAQLATEIVHELEERQRAEKEEDPDELDFGDLSDLGPAQEEDVAIVSSDEDLEDVLDLNGDDVEDEGMRLDIENDDALNPKKAKTMLRHGEINDRPLSGKQKKLFGFVAGGGKPTKV